MDSKFESSVKVIPYNLEAVYRNLSDLRNLEKVRDRVPEDKINDFSFDRDWVSLNVSPVGDMRLEIIDRDEPKCIKFEAAQSPVPFNMWIQLLPIDENSCKMRITLKAQLNPFIKGMVSGPLQEGLEKVADALTQIHYT